MKPEYSELFNPYFNYISLPEIKEDKPLISILCSYYKVGDYVEDALLSILEQTYDNWELICIDDASPDTVAYDVIQRINDPRIKYKRLPKNSGAALARNTAFNMSSGDYILCFDPDDILHPFTLQLLLSRALASSSPDIILYDIKVFGSEVSYWRTKIYDEKELTRRNWIIGPSLVKRKLWANTNGQSSAPELRLGSEDWDFWLCCFKTCDRIVVEHIPLPFLLYRRHSTSSCAKSDFYEYKIRQKILENHKELFDKYGTGSAFLAEGFSKSFYANIDSKQWRQAQTIFTEALKKAEFFSVLRAFLRPLLHRIRLGLRRFLRKFVLNPLGIFPKKHISK